MLAGIHVSTYPPGVFLRISGSREHRELTSAPVALRTVHPSPDVCPRPSHGQSPPTLQCVIDSISDVLVLVVVHATSLNYSIIAFLDNVSSTVDRVARCCLWPRLSDYSFPSCQPQAAVATLTASNKPTTLMPSCVNNAKALTTTLVADKATWLAIWFRKGMVVHLPLSVSCLEIGKPESLAMAGAFVMFGLETSTL